MIPETPLAELTELTELAALVDEVLPILSAWGANLEQQKALLGLVSEEDLRTLRTRLLQNEEGLTRIKTLLAIDENMCRALPHTPTLARLWVTTHNLLLEGDTPLDIMLIEGLQGILRIDAMLNGSESW